MSQSLRRHAGAGSSTSREQQTTRSELQAVCIECKGVEQL